MLFINKQANKNKNVVTQTNIHQNRETNLLIRPKSIQEAEKRRH